MGLEARLEHIVLNLFLRNRGFLGDVGYGDTVKSRAQSLMKEAIPIFLYRISDNDNDHEKTRMRIPGSGFVEMIILTVDQGNIDYMPVHMR